MVSRKSMLRRRLPVYRCILHLEHFVAGCRGKAAMQNCDRLARRILSVVQPSTGNCVTAIGTVGIQFARGWERPHFARERQRGSPLRARAGPGTRPRMS
jgi:hypothetical protein